jgi:hypothetical protein
VNSAAMAQPQLTTLKGGNIYKKFEQSHQTTFFNSLN